MKNIFKRQIRMLKPFKEFLEYKFDAQERHCIKDTSSSVSKIQCYLVIINELFSPQDKTNIATTLFIDNISSRLCRAFL